MLDLIFELIRLVKLNSYLLNQKYHNHLLYRFFFLDKSDPIEKSKVVVQFPSAERFKPSYVHRWVKTISHRAFVNHPFKEILTFCPF